MPASILSIGTSVPEARVSQAAARDVFAAQPGTSRIARRLIHAAFDASDIDHRHTVLTGLAAFAAGEATIAADSGAGSADGTILAPSTGARNDEYIRLAPTLFAEAAAAALSS